MRHGVKFQSVFRYMTYVYTGATFVAFAVAQSAGQTQDAAVYQRVTNSCVLAQAAAVQNQGKYVSIILEASSEKLYSPELAKDDFLAFSNDCLGAVDSLRPPVGFLGETR
jgi:hypothetical protein